MIDARDGADCGREDCEEAPESAAPPFWALEGREEALVDEEVEETDERELCGAGDLYQARELE